MVSKNQIKYIRSLHQKKYRNSSGRFLVEGEKVIGEFLHSDYDLEALYVSSEYLFEDFSIDKVIVKQADLQRMSTLNTANNCLAIFRMREPLPIDADQLVVALDGVRDPGNLGTIIRLCDWFGVRHLLCSPDTVDVYNPKVVQATMGSLTRVDVSYADLGSTLKSLGLPIYMAVMDGNTVYEASLPAAGVLVMGSESHGVSDAIMEMAHLGLTIPKFGLQQTESLNVATAAAILLSEFRRNGLIQK